MPQNGTLFGGRVKFKRGHMGGPDPIRRGHLDTSVHGEKARSGWRGHQADGSTKPGTPEMPARHPKPGQSMNRLTLSLRRNPPGWHLGPGLPAPRLRDSKPPCGSPHVWHLVGAA